jgi:hypothetical protein
MQPRARERELSETAQADDVEARAIRRVDERPRVADQDAMRLSLRMSPDTPSAAARRSQATAGIV